MTDTIMSDTGGVVELDVDINESPALLVDSDDNNRNKRVIRRGLGFTQGEDCMVAKAFIATSEDPIVGVSQKGAQFFAKMQANYVILCGQQEKLDKIEFDLLSRRGGIGDSANAPVVYSLRSIESLNKRFKGYLAPRVMKFMGVESTMELPSGTTEKDEYQLCKEAT
jgi:hypothetical protein